MWGALALVEMKKASLYWYMMMLLSRRRELWHTDVFGESSHMMTVLEWVRSERHHTMIDDINLISGEAEELLKPANFSFCLWIAVLEKEEISIIPLRLRASLSCYTQCRFLVVVVVWRKIIRDWYQNVLEPSSNVSSFTSSMRNWRLTWDNFSLVDDFHIHKKRALSFIRHITLSVQMDIAS